MENQMPSIAYIQNCQIQLQRNTLNQMLEKTDRYILSDYPLTEDQKNEIKIYRQLLRDYFKRDDVINWVFTFENQQLPDFPDMPDFVRM
jgi:hypothetical protein